MGKERQLAQFTIRNPEIQDLNALNQVPHIDTMDTKESEMYEDLHNRQIRTSDEDGKGRWVTRIFFYTHCPRAVFYALGERMYA